MTKKMMLLAFAAVGAALFAMPAVASANWGVDPINQSFSGTSDLSVSGSPFVGNLSIAGEPKWTCEGPSHLSGAWTNGTEGSFSLDITNCHIIDIFTVACKTAGAPVSNTMLVTGKFKNVTIEGGKRGITVTPTPTTINCLFVPVKIFGTIIGRITEDPTPCPEGSGKVDSSVTLEFLISGGVQSPLKTDNASMFEVDDLSAQTEGGSVVTAALENKFTLSTSSNTTWTCNAP
jgi:hypothetical protein